MLTSAAVLPDSASSVNAYNSKELKTRIYHCISAFSL